MALLQFWRESAANATVSRPGDDNRLVVKLPTITRKAIHARCPQKPYLNGLLEGTDPSRAIQYDREAWSYLFDAGIIATDPKTLAFVPKNRKGWKADFRAEEISVRPGKDIAEQIAEIRGRALAARKRNKWDSKLRESNSELREHDSKLRETRFNTPPKKE